MWATFKHNIWQLLICFDQFCFCLICLFSGAKAWADCTLSAAAYMWSKKDVRQWPKNIIDKLFYFIERNHCHKSYINEQERRHIAPSMRKV